MNNQGYANVYHLRLFDRKGPASRIKFVDDARLPCAEGVQGDRVLALEGHIHDYPVEICEAQHQPPPQFAAKEGC
jgi:hypothetical protein